MHTYTIQTLFHSFLNPFPSPSELNYSKPDSSVLYEKEASFVAVLDDDYQSDSPGDYQHDDYQRDDYQRDDYQRDDYQRLDYARDKYNDYRRDDYQRDLTRLEDVEDQPHTAELLEDPSRRKGSSQLIDRADILNYDRWGVGRRQEGGAGTGSRGRPGIGLKGGFWEGWDRFERGGRFWDMIESKG